ASSRGGSSPLDISDRNSASGHGGSVAASAQTYVGDVGPKPAVRSRKVAWSPIANLAVFSITASPETFLRVCRGPEIRSPRSDLSFLRGPCRRDGRGGWSAT